MDLVTIFPLNKRERGHYFSNLFSNLLVTDSETEDRESNLRYMVYLILFVFGLSWLDFQTYFLLSSFNSDSEVQLNYTAQAVYTVYVNGTGLLANRTRNYLAPLNFSHNIQNERTYYDCYRYPEEPNEPRYLKHICIGLTFVAIVLLFPSISRVKHLAFSSVYPDYDLFR